MAPVQLHQRETCRIFCLAYGGFVGQCHLLRDKQKPTLPFAGWSDHNRGKFRQSVPLFTGYLAGQCHYLRDPTILKKVTPTRSLRFIIKQSTHFLLTDSQRVRNGHAKHSHNFWEYLVTIDPSLPQPLDEGVTVTATPWITASNCTFPIMQLDSLDLSGKWSSTKGCVTTHRWNFQSLHVYPPSNSPHSEKW